MEDIATGIRSEHEASQPGIILAVERKSVSDVIGYCGLVFHDNGAPGEPELAYQLLRRAHGFGYATEAGSSVVAWSTAVGYERLWATVRAWNVASRGVLGKLGFCETGQIDPDTTHGDSLLTVRNSPAPSGRDGLLGRRQLTASFFTSQPAHWSEFAKGDDYLRLQALWCPASGHHGEIRSVEFDYFPDVRYGRHLEDSHLAVFHCWHR